MQVISHSTYRRGSRFGCDSFDYIVTGCPSVVRSLYGREMAIPSKRHRGRLVWPSVLPSLSETTHLHMFVRYVYDSPHATISTCDISV